jgi:hypothetical protein
MTFQTPEDGEAERDEAATEAPADEPPASEQGDDPAEPGGPYGNPGVDEESLRKQQEEQSDRGESG